VTLGREAGVPTPLTERLVELIHDVENGARAQSLATLDLLDASRPASVMDAHRV
jgi:2-dehydropantoate 2-reductase